jgi:hypothetical protein
MKQQEMVDVQCIEITQGIRQSEVGVLVFIQIEDDKVLCIAVATEYNLRVLDFSHAGIESSSSSAIEVELTCTARASLFIPGKSDSHYDTSAL